MTPTLHRHARSFLSLALAGAAVTTPASGRADGLQVRLPARADEAVDVRLSDGRGVRIALLAARAAVWTRASADVVVAAGAGPGGADVTLRRIDGGLEDFVSFASPPPAPRVSYRVDVRDWAGLRLVGGALELLDASGTPRLRMAPPWIVDRAGAPRPARVVLRGCAADTSPAPPWGRPPTPSGAPSCIVEVSWQLPDDGYPAVLDPAWTGTGDLVQPRWHQAAVRLADGRVLAAGGAYAVDAPWADLDAAELYDPDTRTWAATGSLLLGRRGAVAAALPDGRAIVAGGSTGFPGATARAETDVYDPATGRFEAGPPLVVPRFDFAAVSLSDGGVLVTGGFFHNDIAEASTERLDASGLAWTSAAPMDVPRALHSATALPDGRVLVVGGGEEPYEAGRPVYGSALVYEPAADRWTPIASQLAQRRYGHSATWFGAGRVMVAGGADGPQGETVLASVELLDLATGAWSLLGSTLATPRWHHGATRLPNGGVLVTGGYSSGFLAGTTRTGELVTPGSSAIVALGDMASPRTLESATLLQDGTVLVAGGLGGAATADLFGSPDGAPCDAADPLACPNGACEGGVCRTLPDAPPQATGDAPVTRSFLSCGVGGGPAPEGAALAVVCGLAASAAARRRSRRS